MRTLASDCRLYANLYVACQSRKGNLEEFFSHENQYFPISISEIGKLRKCNAKSDFLKCLEHYGQINFEAPSVNAKIFDGAVYVMMNPPRTVKTYGEYVGDLCKSMKRIASSVDRLDLVFDRYFEKSLKSQTREFRGVGIRVAVRQETPIGNKFLDFMRNDQNKTELFGMIAESVAAIQCNGTILATKGEHILSNSQIDDCNIAPCNHEEADSRLLLHAYDAAIHGHKKVMITTVDTDVVVIALYHFFSLEVEELWIEFGAGIHRRYIPIHQYARNLKEETCRALPFWYAVSGCDTVSAFAGKGKKTAWQTWDCYPEAPETFLR